MKTKNFKRMIFIGLILLSGLQIVQHFRSIPDVIYGGLIGVIIGIMFIGLYQSIKLKNSTANR